MHRLATVHARTEQHEPDTGNILACGDPLKISPTEMSANRPSGGKPAADLLEVFQDQLVCLVPDLHKILLMSGIAVSAECRIARLA